MATLGDLGTQIAQWLDRDDQDEFPDQVRYWCVNRAVEQILRNSWCRWGLVKTTLTTVAGQQSYALSSIDDNCYDVRAITYQDYSGSDTSNTLDVMVSLTRLSPEGSIEYFANSDDDTKPLAFAVIGSAIELFPVPQDAIELHVIGACLLDELKAESDSNAVTINAAEAVFWLALQRAITFFPGEEERLQIIGPAARRALNELEVQESRAQQSYRPRESLVV